MKNLFKYQILLILHLIIFIITVNGENNSASEKQGYIINPVATPYGIVASNELENVIYLINEEGIKKLVEAPGCGRYLNFSKDYSQIGLKIIDPINELERPAVFNLEIMRLDYLYDWNKRSGQVSFADDGKTAFMINEWMYVRDGISEKKYNLGSFSNNASISPEGSRVVYKNDSDQLLVYDFNLSTREQITENGNGYYNAQWSPDGKSILFESVNAKIYVHNGITGITYLAEGENPRWAPDSKSIVYNRKEIDFANVRLINSDLYTYDLLTNEEKRITNTTDVFEMNASFDNQQDEIIFDTYTRREIQKISPSAHQPKSAETIYKLAEPLKINFNNSMNKSDSRTNAPADLDEWVHIHQVFDTRDSGGWTSDPTNGRHQGYLCCGAASAMEVIASYGILPPEPIYTYGHTSNYGKYISDAYTFNGITYSGFITSSSNPGFPTGAHGFMWNSGGSPHSNSVTFLRNHGIEAVLSDDMSWSKIKSELDTGFPYILCSTGLTDGHIVVAIGQKDNSRTLYCNDPYGDKNAGSYGAIRNGKNAVYDWADENTGHVKITPVVWGVTARYSKTLQLLTSYPADNQTNISPSTHIFINFYGRVNAETVKDNIQLIDETGEFIDYSFDSIKCSEGIVEIIPVNELSENSAYSIYINHQIENESGLQFKRNEQIKFSTSSYGNYTGNILDGFEWQENRSVVFNGTTDEETNVAITDESKKDEQHALKLNYKFSGSSNGFVRVLYSPELEIDLTKSIGMWVFGDFSKNSLELWFTNSGILVKGFSKVLDWSGWKFIELPLEQLNLSDEATFNCFAIRQVNNAQYGGTIYFDGLKLIDKNAEIVDCSPVYDEVNVDLNSSIVISFNCTMDSVSLKNAFKIIPDVPGKLNWKIADNKLIFTPDSAYSGNTTYTVIVDTSAKSLDERVLRHPFVYSFTTKRTKLALTANYPRANETNVSVKLEIILQFDSPINPISLNGNILFVDAENGNVGIRVKSALYSKGIVRFQPETELDHDADYKILLKSGIKDTEGLMFGEDVEINFRTAKSGGFTGTVFCDFENDEDWINPKDNEKSVGVDYVFTNFFRDNKNFKNGSAGGALRYKFKGIKGVCMLEPDFEMSLANKNNFGIWIYGDFSNNAIEYTFSDSEKNYYKIIADTLNYTGWQFVSVDLDSLSNIPGLIFGGIALQQTNTGAYEGEINLDDIQTDIILSAGNETFVPLQFSLKQNYPNPFNPTTTIEYSIPNSEIANGKTGFVSLIVYDILGREVTTLVNQKQKPGIYRIEFNSSSARGGLASGIYFYQIKINSFVDTKKMVILK